jgi:hypothetical protein
LMAGSRSAATHPAPCGSGKSSKINPSVVPNSQSFNAQPQAPATLPVEAFLVAGACGWALKDS